MCFRYAPLALLLAAPPALAQNLDVPENPEFPNTFNQPAFTVNSPAELQRAFHNGPLDSLSGYSMDEMFAPPYYRPWHFLENGPYVVGGTVFTDIVLDAEDRDQDGLTTDTLRQIDLAPPLFEGGPWTDPRTGITYEGTVTGDLVRAEPALACDQQTNTPVALDNASDIAGNVAFIARGSCFFSVKAVSAQRAGARAVVIYIPNNTGLDSRGAINMAPNLPGDGSESDLYTSTDSLGLSIPVVLIPDGVAMSILDRLYHGGGTVNVTLGVGPVRLFVDGDGDGVADPETPGLTDFDPPAGTLIVAAEPATAPRPPTLAVYPNPASGVVHVTLAGRDGGPVRVAVYDVLGRQVALLHDGPVAGEDVFDLDASALPPGLYLVRAAGAAFSQTTRLTVAR